MSSLTKAGGKVMVEGTKELEQLKELVREMKEAESPREAFEKGAELVRASSELSLLTKEETKDKRETGEEA